MATMTVGKRTTLASGSWRGVRDVPDPFDAGSEQRYLSRASNIYIPDPEHGSGAYQRPAFLLANTSTPMADVSTGRVGQAITVVEQEDGTALNFVVVGGRLYRVSGDFATRTDVTPTSITIDPDARVGLTPFSNRLIVTDGVHTPWVASALTATPVTATLIDYGRADAATSTGAILTLSGVTVSSRAFTYLINGTLYAKAAVATVTMGSPAPPDDSWGAWLVTIATNGTITAAAANDNTTGYASEALALADLPAAGANTVTLGTVTTFNPIGVGPNDWAVVSTSQTDPWQARGPAEIHQGSPFFIVEAVAGDASTVERPASRIAWSEPDDPFTGYLQPAFDNVWDIVQNVPQTGQTKLRALSGSNRALTYIREGAIGYATGIVGPDFRTTATHDAVDQHIGARAPAAIARFGNAIYFVDGSGRPHRITDDGALEEGWLQLRRAVTAAVTRYPEVTARTAVGAVVTVAPEIDLYVVAIWSPDPTASPRAYPTELQVFDAKTGLYAGTWTIGPGVAIHAVGVLKGANGESVLAVLGTKAATQATAAGGYLWTLASPDADEWTDDEAAAMPSVTTQPLGYSPDTILTVDRCLAITGTDAPCRATVQTTTSTSTVEGTATPAVSADGTYRLVWSTDDVGRGVAVTIGPLATTAQWRCDRIVATVIPSVAGEDDG